MAGGKSKMKKKLMLMDLDNEDDDDEGDEGVMEKEKKFHEQLEKLLTRCQLCGPTKLCQISCTGQHVCNRPRVLTCQCALVSL